MSNLSLQAVMNEMAQGDVRPRPYQPRDNAFKAPAPSQKPITELQAFIQLDPVLASLHKQFLEAKAQHAALVSANGKNDAMAEVAADMMDSAWCAMQTRFIEVRADRQMMQEAQAMMRLSIKMIEEKRDKDKSKEALKLFQKMELLKLAEKQRKDRVPFFEIGFIFLLFDLIPAGINKPQQQYTRAA